MLDGSKSCARTPLLGDARLISAMMAGGPLARAARKSRRAARHCSAARSQAASGWIARARSSRFLATIRARMSGTVSIKGVDPMVSDTGESDFDAEARRRGAEWGYRNWGGAGFHATEEFRGGMGWETRERDFDAEARRRGGKRGERMAEMGGRRVPGRVEKA